MAVDGGAGSKALAQESFIDFLTVPESDLSVWRSILALGQITAREGMHDVRDRVETDSHGMLRMGNEGRGDVAGNATGGVGTIIVRIKDSSLRRTSFVIQERYWLGSIPGETGTGWSGGPATAIQVTGKKGRLARLGRPPNAQRMLLTACRVKLGQDVAATDDAVDGIKPGSAWQPVLPLPNLAMSPIPINEAFHACPILGGYT